MSKLGNAQWSALRLYTGEEAVAQDSGTRQWHKTVAQAVAQDGGIGWWHRNRNRGRNLGSGIRD
jgi:hypothetical protein